MESIKATVKFKIEYPRAVRSVFLDTQEQLSSISYANLVRLCTQSEVNAPRGRSMVDFRAKLTSDH